ncbi:hypothetical protein NLU13_9114 [Sarocladium strictum]|uniref:Amino acid transporter n=1 Tax=Sarocladium strictum TaxID=5046 RepID=A0AA39GA05_SARSR|nr:hypothetical protein NLU13_9114 [Sarocladium strictum]
MADSHSSSSVNMKEKTVEKEPSAAPPLETVNTLGTATFEDVRLTELGYIPSFRRTRSTATILFMTLAIAAIPFGIGSPLMVGLIGGGPLALFVGLFVVSILDGAVAVSLAELAARYPTSAGPYYWTFQIASTSSNMAAEGMPRLLSYLNGWIWLIGNWTITLSVNFGFASLIAATVTMYNPDWTATEWELLLIFYAICLMTLLICFLGDRILPMVDTFAATATLITVVAVAIALGVTAKAGRRSAGYALGHYDASFSGYPDGFAFFIGLLPPAYTFSAIGMISSMAEECHKPESQVPTAIIWTIPIGAAAALIFLLPILFTLPPMEDILAAPNGQALPYIVYTVMGNRAGAAIIMTLVFVVTLFCSISVTTTASRCTFAFARDKTIPLWSLWSKMHYGQPLAALILVTVVQMLLGLINLGSTSAFTAFVSVGVVALALGYLVPISTSFLSGRKQVSEAAWTAGPLLGSICNVVAITWILFEVVLFSMPVAIPVTPASMNYASVVQVGFAVIGVVFYYCYGRKYFKGPGVS